MSEFRAHAKTARGSISWTRVAGADIIDGLRTLPDSLGGGGRCVWDRARKTSPQEYVQWARNCLRSGSPARSPDASAVSQAAHEATANAKRALDRLFDQYLERDWLHVRLSRLGSFAEKLELLQNRHGEVIPARLAQLIIAVPRNDAEHEHIPPTLEKAELAVEAAALVVDALTRWSDPRNGVARLDFWEHAEHSNSETGTEVSFDGFNGPFAVIWTASDCVHRIGVGVPTSQTFACMTWCPVSELSRAEHLEMLQLWESKLGVRRGGFMGEPLVNLLFELAGITIPH